MSSIEMLSILFEALPLGVVVLDASGKVVVYNRAEELLANRPRDLVMGRDFFAEVAPCMDVRQLAGEFRERIGKSQLGVDVEFSFPFPFMEQPRDVRVKMSSFDVRDAPYAFLLIEDVSTRRSVERMKSTLQDLLVHDLKNPLAAMHANLSFLQDFESIRDNRDALDAITDSLRASERLQSMLLNLLDITRLETNSLPLHLSELPLDDVLKQVVEDNLALARDSGASLEMISSPLRAVVDRTVLRRALNNLVENALRHGARVTVQGREDGDTVAIDVADDGPGVPEALRSRIFEKYAKVTDGSQKATYNRGLGLTFVRLVAQAHGGDASVECPAAGGSIFRISMTRRLRAPSL